MRLFLSILMIFSLILISPKVVMANGWVTISEIQSMIYSSLDQESFPYVHKKYAKTEWDDDEGVRSFRIRIRGNNSFGTVLLHETARDIFFPTIPTPSEAIKSFNFLKSNHSVQSKEQLYKTEQLNIGYILVDKAMRRCIVFVGTWNQGSGDSEFFDGAIYIPGFYCYPLDAERNQKSINLVLGSIGIKEIGRNALTGRIVKEPKPSTKKTGLTDHQIFQLKVAKDLFEKGRLSAEQYKNVTDSILMD